MNEQDTIRRLKRQLLIERVVTGAIALLLLVCWIHGRFLNAKAFILVDGKPIVCVPSEDEAGSILTEIKTETGCDPKEIEFKEEVCVARAPRNADPVSRHKAMRIVQQAVSPIVPRWAIIVEGEPIAALPDEEAAGKTLDLAKLKFGKEAENLAEEPQFKENVTVDRVAVNPAVYCKCPEDAIAKLFEKASSVTTNAVYTVKKGDIGGSVAERHGLTISELAAMNPGVNLHRLQIGDKLQIKKTEVPKAKLTVVVRDLVERVETIKAPVHRVSSMKLYVGKTAEISPGRSGKRRVKVAKVYENGRLTGSEILEEELLREPIARQLAVGIRQRH